MINWRGFQQVEDETLIHEVELKYGINLPKDYIQIVKKYDGGVPDRKVFQAGGKQRVFQRLISIQLCKHPNVLDAVEWIDSENSLPFALDPFGNVICFNIMNHLVDGILFIETETQAVFPVSSSLTDFINELK